jgi:hypothetical protein
LPEGHSAEVLRDLTRPTVEEMLEDPDYAEFNDYLHGDLAAEETARLWVANLRPEIRVGWFEDGFGVTQFYDPAVAEWVDAI